jgi:hypothetical protein
MAHHYREAGVADAASTYFERAGDRAAARSGYIEATAHFRAAIEQADRLSQKDERARRALTLLLKLGPAIAVTIGQWKGKLQHVAVYGFQQNYLDYMQSHPLGLDRGSISGRAVLERGIVHVDDVLADPEFTLVETQKLGSFRTALGDP